MTYDTRQTSQVTPRIQRSEQAKNNTPPRASATARAAAASRQSRARRDVCRVSRRRVSRARRARISVQCDYLCELQTHVRRGPDGETHTSDTHSLCTIHLSRVGSSTHLSRLYTSQRCRQLVQVAHVVARSTCVLPARIERCTLVDLPPQLSQRYRSVS